MQLPKEQTEILASTDATMLFGQTLAMNLEPTDVLLLQGELGAGKTTLSKGILTALGVTDDITSPTFTLMNVYHLPQPKNGITVAVHVDAYRIDQESELFDIGLQDYLGQRETLCLIEWPEKLPNLLRNIPTNTITLEHVPEGRKATLS